MEHNSKVQNMQESNIAELRRTIETMIENNYQMHCLIIDKLDEMIFKLDHPGQKCRIHHGVKVVYDDEVNHDRREK